jgi:hypothetical protein
VSALAEQDETTPPEDTEAVEPQPEDIEAVEPQPEDTEAVELQPAESEPVQTPPAEEAPTPPRREPSLDDIAAQIDAIPIGPFLLSFVSTLLSRAYGKLGKGELDEARGAIDAIRALMPVIEGRVEPELKRDFDQALANLQVAYADASTKDPS